MQTKKAYSYGETAFNPNASWLQLFNPLSQVFPGSPDRVPHWMNKMPFSQDTNYLLLKSGACALLASALVAGARFAQHVNTVGEIRKRDRTVKDMPDALNYSYELSTKTKQDPEKSGLKELADAAKSAIGFGKESSLHKVAEEPEHSPSSGDTWEGLGAILPLGAMLLASGLTYKAVDSWADARKNRILDKRIDSKQRYMKQLIVGRAQNAKTPLSAAAVNKLTTRPDFEAEPLQAKQGSFRKEGAIGKDDAHGVRTGVGLAAAALLATAAYASYKYAEASDENNIKAKAYEKGLREYAAQRSRGIPLQVRPTDASLFNAIDEHGAKPTSSIPTSSIVSQTPEALSISL